MAKAYMMTTMSQPLQMQHEHLNDALEIMNSLEAQFSVADRASRFNLMREIFAKKMTDGSSVREHVTMMIHMMDQLTVEKRST